jgi:hypothetical protein
VLRLAAQVVDYKNQLREILLIFRMSNFDLASKIIDE